MKQLEESKLSDEKKKIEILKALEEGNTLEAPPMGSDYIIRKAEKVGTRTDISSLTRTYRHIFIKLRNRGLIEDSTAQAPKWSITEEGLEFLEKFEDGGESFD